MIKQKNYLSSPVQVDIELTEYCPLECIHCSVEASIFREKCKLTTETWKNVLEELKDNKVFMVYFVGGEPFARPDLSELCRYAKELGFNVGIGSNGFYITQKIINKIKDFVDYIQISLDGVTSKTHNKIRGMGFKAAINSMKLIVRSNIPLHVATVVCQTNFTEIKDVFKFAKKIGSSKFKLLSLQFAGRARKIWQTENITEEQWTALINFFIEEIEREDGIKIEMSLPLFTLINLISPQELLVWRESFPRDLIPHICGCGKSRCTITSGGNVLPCDLSRFVVAGNILNEDFRNIWQSEIMHPFRFQERYIPKECKECPYSRICAGGCIGTRYNFYGNLKRRDPRCKISVPQ